MFENQHPIQLIDLGYLTLGAVVVAAGVVSLLVTLRRRERQDLTLTFFGCLSLFVGLRFLVSTSALPLALGGSQDLWDFGRAFLTYALAVTAFAAVHTHLGPGWGFSLRWVAWGYFAFACVALAAKRIGATVNNFVIVVALAVIFANVVRPVFRQNRGAQVIAVCSMAGIMFFLLEGLRSLGIVSVDFHTKWVRASILHSTMLVLILVVHYLSIREERLAAVRHELRTAREIQTSILPRTTPTVSGLEIAARYEPVAEVAGDFYDFSVMDGRCLGVLVTDVSGHGVPAALVAAMVKVAFLAQADQAREPARMLAGLNRIFGGRLGNHFATAGYAFVDLDAGQLQYSGAAHPALLVRPGDGREIICIEKNGLMLGPFPDAKYETVSRDLNPGDRIVMYTDGIPEAANGKDEQFGEERMLHCLAGSAGITADEFADRLMTEVKTWARGQLSDDLTLLVIDVLADGQQSATTRRAALSDHQC